MPAPKLLPDWWSPLRATRGLLDAYGQAFDAGLLGGISRRNDIWSANSQAQGRLQAILSSIGRDAHHLGEPN